MRRERVGNLGYLGFSLQTDAHTPVAATDFVPLYEENMTTDRQLQDQAPIYGNKFETFNTLPGARSHKGDVTVLFEPNTAAKFFDMLLTRGDVSGTTIYTRDFRLTPDGENYYTFDISTGNVVKRFFGVLASKIEPSMSDNETQLKVSVSALGAFDGRAVASVSGTTVTLKTDYGTNPAKGLVKNDLVRLWKQSDNSTSDFTVASVGGDTTVTLDSQPSGFADGDMLYLRPATVAFNLLPTLLWTSMKFYAGDTVSDALASTPIPVESDSTWELDHNFNNDSGENRSGSQDPASLVRTTGNCALTIKKFFDTPEDIKAYENTRLKKAWVIRNLCHANGNEYEVRIIMNALVTDDPLPQMKPKEISYSNIQYHPTYSQEDGQGMSVKIVNNLQAIS